METKARIHDISIDFESGKQVISLVCEKDIRGEYDRLKDKECRLKVVQAGVWMPMHTSMF